MVGDGPILVERFEVPEDAAVTADVAAVDVQLLGEPVEDVEAQRRPFRQLRELYEQLRADGLPLDTLSMGMSHDIEAAIAEGATMVRVGTAIFGERSKA